MKRMIVKIGLEIDLTRFSIDVYFFIINTSFWEWL